jgi:hypothetical protein
MDFLAFLFIRVVLGGKFIVSEEEMTAIASTTYCVYKGFHPWYIGVNLNPLSSLTIFLKSQNLNTAWIGPQPNWDTSKGAEFVTLEDNKVSFGLICKTNNEIIKKRTICMIIDENPTKASPIKNQVHLNPDNIKGDPDMTIHEKICLKGASKKQCCVLI